MLHHFVKNALMSILEKLSAWWWISAKSDYWSSDSCEWKCKYGTIISAASCCCWRHKLAERQSLYKAVDIKDCSQWAERFTARIIHKYKSSDEVCLIFDKYKLPKCLKTATWINRQAGQDPYINVLVIPCFSHCKTENELSILAPWQRTSYIMLWIQIYKLLGPGVTTVVQHNKMETIFKVIKKKQTPRWCCYMLWTQLPAVQWSFISTLQTQR